MASRKFSAIKIKKLCYANPLTAAPTKSGLTAALAAATEISNVHGTTFQYEESEASVTPYKNQLTGKDYRQDIVPGDKQISFTVGQYDFAMKAALQGGTATDDSWIPGDSSEIQKKCIYAITEDDICICFPSADIVARGSSTDNAVGLALRAKALETDSMKEEYWFDVRTA